jgi:predicted phosphodiesterase
MTMKKINYEKVLFIPDIHAPFQDDRALNILYQFIKWFKPSTIIILGDILDCYAISRFTKDPNGALKFQQELDEAQNILGQIRKSAPKADIRLIKGNHEARIQKFLWSNAKELANLHALEIENLLGLKNFNIKWIKEGMTNIFQLVVKHGSVVRKYSGYTAKAEFERNGCSGVSAHTHRQCIYRHSNNGGDYIWMETGHLADPNQEYLEGEKPNWQQGFGVGWFKKGSKRYHLELIPINNYKAFYGGLEFTS